jgi:tRNA(Ile)-lysidine synthase
VFLNPRSTILTRVTGTIDRYHMVKPGDCIGVAVSGGVDSVVLLDILANLRKQFTLTLMVLHLNHGIRGEEAARDERFVQDLSTRYDLPYVSSRADAPSYRKEHSLSPQEAAREVRYHFFAEAIRAHALDKVAVGQTADDQAETVLMRFIRGGGPSGLKGIPPVRGTYIRPLIEIWRAELAHYAEYQGLSFVHDSSNNDEHYLRNRLRHRLMPALAEYNPSIKDHLLHVAQVLGEDDAYLDGLAQEVAADLVTVQGEDVVITIPSLLALPPALQARILKHAFAQVCPDGVLEFSHLRGIRELIREGGGTRWMALPKGYTAMRSYEHLTIGTGRAPMSKQEEVETELVIPGRTRLAAIGVEIEATMAGSGQDPHADPQAAYLDYKQVVLPLRCRTFRPGDSFIPLGMHAPKKLQDFFIDLKIPRAERGRVPLVVSGTDICWVGGLRIDERCKVTARTTQVLRLAMTRLEGLP